jgi:hypothetical protein
MENAGVFVWFDGPVERRYAPVEVVGDRATLTMAGVLVSIQAPPQLRDRILGAVREVAPASAGCPATHPISADPAWRPTAAIPVGHLSDVTEVVACKYPLPIGDEATALKSSVTLIGEPAADAMAGIAGIADSGGPDDPGECAESFAYGDEVIVLRVESGQGPSEIVLRYSGCEFTTASTTARTCARCPCHLSRRSSPARTR